MSTKIILNECPRDAMQGLSHFVPTELKIKYLNALLQVGFARLDFGSFVSPKAIPQLRDTGEVVDGLLLEQSKTKLLAIIANLRGAEQAADFEQIEFLGFPLSISEQFQQRNTHKSISEALAEIGRIQNLCLVRSKKLLVYLSMAFGNPYGEAYSSELVLEAGQKLLDLNIQHIALSDTVGMATTDEIEALFSAVSEPWKTIELTAHLHATPQNVASKVEAAYLGGCRQFDVALGGYGGCPMAEDELVGNLDTDLVMDWATDHGHSFGFDRKGLKPAKGLLAQVFFG